MSIVFLSGKLFAFASKVCIYLKGSQTLDIFHSVTCSEVTKLVISQFFFRRVSENFHMEYQNDVGEGLLSFT